MTAVKPSKVRVIGTLIVVAVLILLVLDTTTRSDNDPHADRLYANADWEIVDVVERIANARGVSMAQIALAWLLSKRDVTAPIVGATKPNHLGDAIAALDIVLSAEEIEALEAPYTPKPVMF